MWHCRESTSWNYEPWWTTCIHPQSAYCNWWAQVFILVFTNKMVTNSMITFYEAACRHCTLILFTEKQLQHVMHKPSSLVLYASPVGGNQLLPSQSRHSRTLPVLGRSVKADSLCWYMRIIIYIRNNIECTYCTVRSCPHLTCDVKQDSGKSLNGLHFMHSERQSIAYESALYLSPVSCCILWLHINQ